MLFLIRIDRLFRRRVLWINVLFIKYGFAVRLSKRRGILRNLFENIVQPSGRLVCKSNFLRLNARKKPL